MSGQAPPSGDDTARGRGRPTKYKPEYAKQAAKACEAGFTDRDIAELLGVCEATLNTWKHEHPEFLESVKVGKAAADDRVEQSLYRKATGYSFDAVKIFQNAGEIIRADYVEHVPPSDTAAIFWLKNRRKEEWRDKTDVEHTGLDAIAAAIAAGRQRAASLSDGE